MSSGTGVVPAESTPWSRVTPRTSSTAIRPPRISARTLLCVMSARPSSGAVCNTSCPKNRDAYGSPRIPSTVGGMSIVDASVSRRAPAGTIPDAYSSTGTS